MFTPEQYELIKRLKGELGQSDSEVVRNIVLAWLAEKSFLSLLLKDKLKNLDRGWEEGSNVRKNRVARELGLY